MSSVSDKMRKIIKDYAIYTVREKGGNQEAFSSQYGITSRTLRRYLSIPELEALYTETRAEELAKINGALGININDSLEVMYRKVIDLATSPDAGYKELELASKILPIKDYIEGVKSLQVEKTKSLKDILDETADMHLTFALLFFEDSIRDNDIVALHGYALEIGLRVLINYTGRYNLDESINVKEPKDKLIEDLLIVASQITRKNVTYDVNSYGNFDMDEFDEFIANCEIELAELKEKERNNNE
jgi:hypothetical protein